MKTLIISARGKFWLDKRGRERPYRWYHSLADEVERWWYSRDWRRRQAEFKRTGTRYYGDGGTIHSSTALDVEVDAKGNVVAVWFRCQPLPFRQNDVDDDRAGDMRRMYTKFSSTLHGVEVRD